MPVTLEPPSAVVHAAWNPRERLRRRAIRDPGRRILVGLVNNMPDGALAATERQFARLLEDAGADYDVRLRLYALESMPRSLEARRAMQATYHRARSLCVTRLDALIATGAEPRAPSLPEEIYWRELVSIFDRARERDRRYSRAWPRTPQCCIGTQSRGFRWRANCPGSLGRA